MSKNKEIITTINQEQLNELKTLAPVSNEYEKKQFKRLGMLAKDITEESGTGKNKKIEVLNVAGEFYIEERTDEVNEAGKNIYKKNFFDTPTIEGVIVYFRKQLSFWDDSLKVFINTPLFDDVNDVVPLWEGGKEIARKTPRELQAMYPSVTAKGKPSSKLKEVTVLYVLVEGEVYEMTLSVSSGYSFKDYKKKTIPSSVVTVFGSKEETHGTNTYNVMTFTVKNIITPEQFEEVKETVRSIRDGIQAEKAFYAGLNTDIPTETPEEREQRTGESLHLKDGHAM